MNACSVPECGLESRARGYCRKHYIRMLRTGRLTTVRHLGPFWEKVAKGAPESCWPWTGYRKPSGHGLTTYKCEPIHASRKAWILTHGPIAEGLSVLHRCDNAACCNPQHLYLGTRIDNMIDLHAATPSAERCARGRPHMLDDTQLARLWLMRREGASIRECAAEFKCHVSTICRYITAVRKQSLTDLRADRLSRERLGRV